MMAADVGSAASHGGLYSIKLLDVTYLLKAVDEQAADLLKTAEHVNRNISEARRLRRMKEELLNAEEQTWMDANVADTTRALQDIARIIEPARVDTVTNASRTISPKNKVLWVFRDGSKIRDKHAKLTICHQSLIGVINALYAKDVVTSPSELAASDAPPPPYSGEMQRMLDWQRQKRRRRNTANVQPGQKPEVGQSSVSVLTPPDGSPRLELNLDKHMSLISLISEDTAPSETGESVCDASETASQGLKEPIAESSDTSEPRSAVAPEIERSSRKRDSIATHPTSPPLPVTDIVEGSDGLQVVEYHPYRPPSSATSPQESPSPCRTHVALRVMQDFWSPVNVGLENKRSSGVRLVTSVGMLTEAVDAPLKKVPTLSQNLDSKDSESRTNCTGSVKSADDDVCRQDRSCRRSRGQQWLASYAARSDLESRVKYA